MKAYVQAIRFMVTMLISCLLAVVVGLWVDKKLHTIPLFLFVLLVYAIGANFYLLWKGMKDDA